MLNQERCFSRVTRYTSSAPAAKMHRINCVVRQKSNRTPLDFTELVDLWEQVKEMMKPNSSYRALFAPPDWEAAWTLKFPDPRQGEQRRVEHDVIQAGEHEKERKKKQELVVSMPCLLLFNLHLTLLDVLTIPLDVFTPFPSLPVLTGQEVPRQQQEAEEF